MKQDIILAGVGGQGILSIAFVIDNAALKEGLNFKQAEVHGMSQRGGAVQSHLRISNDEIYSDLIPMGEADILLSVEPMETLRYFEYLHPRGIIVTSSTPFKNIPDYPDVDIILSKVKTANKAILVDAEKMAEEAGSKQVQNMVMLGAASPYLIVKATNLEAYIKDLFAPKGERVVEINLSAFKFGRKASGE